MGTVAMGTGTVATGTVATGTGMAPFACATSCVTCFHSMCCFQRALSNSSDPSSVSRHYGRKMLELFFPQ